METLSREELERMIFFEQAKDQAEQDVEKDSSDTSAWTRWGGALLELAHYRQGHEALELMDMAVEKFNRALKINSRKADTLWCLGNAYTSQGFLSAETSDAHLLFDKAVEAFEKALAEDPNNEDYRKCLSMAKRAPSLYVDIQNQLAGQGSGAAKEVRGPANPAAKWDMLCDVAGWGVLVSIGIAWIFLARSETAPPNLKT